MLEIIDFVGFYRRDMKYYKDKNHIRNWSYFSFVLFSCPPLLILLLNTNSTKAILGVRNMCLYTYRYVCLQIHMCSYRNDGVQES